MINADPTIRKVLVVTKASLKQNWANELRRWLVRPMKVAIQRAGESWVGNYADVTVINYDICARYKEQIHAVVWDAVGVDEIQQAKNRKAKRTEVVLGAPKRKKKVDGQDVMLDPEPGIRGVRRVAITGTPIEQRPEEIYTTLRWLDPDRWPSFWKFAGRYCGASFGGGYGSSTQGASNLPELQRVLRSTCMVRRLKSEVLKELPPKTRMVFELEPDEACLRAISDEQRVMDEFDEELTQAQAEVEVAKLDDAPFEEAVKRLVDGRRLAFTEMARVRHQTAVAKVNVVAEALEDDLADAGKVLVFGHHKDVLEALHRKFPSSVLITGDTPPDKRQGIVDRFQSDPGTTMFLGSIRATGEGLTLTAAKLVAFVEEDWVPGKMTQCEDRAHRIGQRDNVLVKHYVLPGSIDVKIAKTAVSKQNVIDRALDRDMMPVEMAAPIFQVTLGSVLDSTAACGKDLPVSGTSDGSDVRAAVVVTDTLREHVHRGLKQLAGCDTDWATEVNGVGFNKMDGAFGHSLAERGRLTDRQVVFGIKLVTKYRKQLGDSYGRTLKELTA